MRLRGVKRSRNVEDRRRMRGGGGAGIGGLGVGGVLLVLAIGYFTGVDVTPFLTGSGGTQGAQVERDLTPAEEKAGDFTLRVLATTEEFWGRTLPEQAGIRYQPPVLVLYAGVTQSPCGGASGATGPFYCPADRKAYLDTAFFATLAQRLGAGGDFAAAYVVAHEVAHHVQDELGILGEANRVRSRAPEREANALTVRLELQADCLSGVWASGAAARFGSLERGDIEEALNAAARIGDDALQKRSQGFVGPDSFTHGSSEQRVRWFETGLKTGDIQSCDTFSTRNL